MKKKTGYQKKKKKIYDERNLEAITVSKFQMKTRS